MVALAPLLLVAVSGALGLPVFDVTKFGAKGDGKTLNTKAIQAALNAAEGTGGTVVIPEGTFMTGSLFLRSNMTLHLTGVLEAVPPNWTRTWEDYPPVYDPDPMMVLGGVVHAGILNGGRCKKASDTPTEYGDQCLEWETVRAVTIEGEVGGGPPVAGRSLLRGNGEKWWAECTVIDHRQEKWAQQVCPDGARFADQRPRAMHLMHIDGLVVRSLQIENSPFWNIMPQYTDNLLIEHVTIFAPVPSPNTDGIDPSSCRNVTVRNSWISVGDDCMAVDSGSNWQGILVNRTTHNVTVENLYCGTSHGLSVGSRTAAGVSKVRFHNVTLNGSLHGPRMKTCTGRGGMMEDIEYDTITLLDVKVGFDINMAYGDVTCMGSANASATPHYRNLRFRNIKGVKVGSPGRFEGLDGNPIDGLVLDRVDLGLPTAHFSCKHVRNISARSVTNPSLDGTSCD